MVGPTKNMTCNETDQLWEAAPPLSTSLKMRLKLGKNLDLRPFSTFNEVTFDTGLLISLGWTCRI
jgi:hypothetical protein